MSKMNFMRLQTAIEESLKGKKHNDVDIFLTTETYVDVLEDHHVKVEEVEAEQDRVVIIYEDGSFITLMDAYDLCKDAIAVVIHCGDYNRNPFKDPSEKEKIIL